MPIEKSAGAVIFRKEPSFAPPAGGATKDKESKIFYLLLQYPSSSRTVKKEYWGFPKGHIEKGEEIETTAKREVEEETGLRDIKFVNGFSEWEKYFFVRDKKKIFKIVTFLLAETKTKEIKISREHLDFKWFSYQEAIEKLTFKNAREILKKANDFLLKPLTNSTI